jgi:hypothetical protein
MPLGSRRTDADDGGDLRCGPRPQARRPRARGP